MYGWNDFYFKNLLGAAYNQVRFIVRNLRYKFYIWQIWSKPENSCLITQYKNFSHQTCSISDL